MPSSTSRTTKKATPATPIPTAPDQAGDKYAADTWLTGGIGGMEDLTVPSGQVCLVRRPGLEGLIKNGVLRNVDSLSALVNEKHIKKTKKGQASDVNVDSILKDPAALDSIMHTVDKAVCFCVVRPEIHMAPNDITSRVPGVVYTDMVGIEDKMFIFNFVVGGTRDLESFRGGLDGAVGGVAAGEGVPEDAE
jgi:hypothetical protein